MAAPRTTLMSGRNAVEIGSELVMGVAPPVATFALGLSQTLQIIGDSSRMVHAMILFGSTTGVTLGQYMRVSSGRPVGPVWLIGIGAGAAMMWGLNDALVSAVARAQHPALWWQEPVSGVLIFAMFAGWCLLSSLAGSIATANSRHRNQTEES